MKRIFLAAAAVLMCTTAVMGQQKVDVEGWEKKIAKSDEEIADPKKSTKAATWLNRGNLFYDAAEAPSKGAFYDMDKTRMDDEFGDKPESKPQVTVGSKKYNVNQYPGFTAYMEQGKLKAWTDNLDVYSGALDKAAEAYVKAYELDGKQEDKARDGLKKVVNLYKQRADNFLRLQKLTEAGDNFRKAFDIGQMQPMNEVNGDLVYKAGFMYTAGGEYEKALPNLLEAVKLGVYGEGDDQGDVYYYIFHCYHATSKDYESARETLLEGIEKFPANTKLIEALVATYSMLPNADPGEVVPIVAGALEKDPGNANLWTGLGNVYDKVGQPEKAMEAFQKAAELAPDDFVNLYNIANLYLRNAERLTKELNSSLDGISAEDYKLARIKVEEAYSESIPYFEKALALKPDYEPMVSLLKSITFILRDSSEEMMDKYNMYDEMLTKMKGGAE